MHACMYAALITHPNFVLPIIDKNRRCGRRTAD